MPTRYDKEFKQNIINLYKQGESAAQLVREYGIGYSTVHKWIQGQAKTQQLCRIFLCLIIKDVEERHNL